MPKPVQRKKTISKSKPRQAKEARAPYAKSRAVPHAQTRQAENEFMRVLKMEKARLLEDLAKQQVQSQDRPATGNHMADDATQAEEQATTLALRLHLERMAKEVDRAMERIEKGTFGLCEKCGKPIGDERLKAMPWVTLCIEDAKLAQAPKLKSSA